MGNSGFSTAESSYESRFIASVENLIGLQHQNSLNVEYVVRRYVVGNRIHRRAVHKLEQELNLVPSNVLSAIYDAMSVSTEYVNSKLLMYFYICLAEGSKEQKAEQIWTLFDPEATDLLTQASIKDIYETATRCALDLAGFVVRKNEVFTEERMDQWRQDMRNRKNKALETFVSRFAFDSDNISMIKFFQVLASYPELDFTDLTNIRTQIEKVSLD